MVLHVYVPESWSNWNLKMLVFEDRGTPEYPKKNVWEQGGEPTINSTDGVDPGIWTQATLVRAQGSHAPLHHTDRTALPNNHYSINNR